MPSRLIWNGDQLLARIHAAERTAIEHAAEAGAEHARQDHPGWHNRTGAGERSIQAMAPRTTPTSVAGAVGFAIRPVRFQDRGFRSHPGDRGIERAVDREVRTLADRLRAAIGSR
jgi:hypothetical protein